MVRIFVNYDKKRLRETNYRAHTKLAQVHFPQLINDRVGTDLFREEFDRFLRDSDSSNVSEQTFFKNLPHQRRSEFKQYFQNYLRYEVLTGKAGNEDSQILSFTETVTARSNRFPLSYDAVQKTFLQNFLHLKPTTEPIIETEKFRQLERENLVRLMNLFVGEVLANGRFDLNLGTYRMEERLANSPGSIPDSHLRAYRNLSPISYDHLDSGTNAGDRIAVRHANPICARVMEQGQNAMGPDVARGLGSNSKNDPRRS